MNTPQEAAEFLTNYVAEQLEIVEKCEKTIADKQGIIEALNNQIENQKIKLDEKKKSVDMQIIELDDDLETFNKEKNRLTEEVSGLVAKKASIQTENIRLTKSSEELKSYMKIAMAALDTKDKELVEREKQIAQKEQFKQIQKSFLPPKE
jgi:chromosome segregation ATPase